MKHIQLILYISFLLVSFCRAQNITITEVMFDVPGSDYYDEFIELYNCGMDSISLAGYYLGVSNTSDQIVSPDLIYSLAPGGFALILDRGYLIENFSSTYDSLIPPGTLLLTIDDNSFGQSGLSNTEQNLIYLIAPNGDTMSSMITTPGQDPGYSDEKIILCEQNNPANWGNSIAFLGTPGFINSISPLPRDVMVSDLSVSPDFPGSEDSVILSVKIANIGTELIDSCTIHLFKDRNQNLVLDPEEELCQNFVPYLPPLDTMDINACIVILPPGFNRISVWAELNNDNRPENNFLTRQIPVHYSGGCIRINEVMYKPGTGSIGEWLEIVNSGRDTIQMQGWSICDRSSAAVFNDSSLFLPPDSFLVIANSSQGLSPFPEPRFIINLNGELPGLNNTDDSLTITDLTGFPIDHLVYHSFWGGGTDISLERKIPSYKTNDPKNWSSCIGVYGGTPGFANSIEALNHDLAVSYLSLSDSIINYSDTFKILISLTNAGQHVESNFLLSVYEQNIQINSRLVADSIPVLGTYTDSFLCLVSEYGFRNLAVECNLPEDENISNNRKDIQLYVSYPSNCIAINEIMYYPLNQQPEWIELLNIASFPVNLRGWTIFDASKAGKEITTDEYWLESDSFCVIAASEDIFSSFNLPPEKVLIPENGFPVLNNDYDSVRVFDYGFWCIDKQYYNRRFGRAAGVSLERIDPYYNMIDSTNWGLCVDINGATPGRKNSITKKPFDLDFRFRKDTLFLDNPDNVLETAFTITNTGKNSLLGFNLCIYLDKNMNGFPENDELVKEKYLDGFILPGHTLTDSIELFFTDRGFHNLTGILKNDSLSQNAIDSFIVYVGYPNKCLVINEIMYSPASGSAEWLELYNPGSLSVSLQGWYMRDAGHQPVLLTKSNFLLPHDGYLLIAPNAEFIYDFPWEIKNLITPDQFPSLNNASDSVFIIEPDGSMVDSLGYSSEWGGGNGVSLERISPFEASQTVSNWTTCENPYGATPGIRNSVTPQAYDLGIDSLKINLSFPDSTCTDFDIELFISNRGFNLLDSVAFLVLCDSQNILSGTITEIGNSISCLFSPQEWLCSGVYSISILLISSRDSNPFNDTIIEELCIPYPQNSVQFNEIMIDPGSAYPWSCEWTELVNTKNNVLNLKYWKVGDLRTFSEKISGNFHLSKGAPVVLSGDSSIYAFPGISTERILIFKQFPSLGNSGDVLYLIDPTGKVIDSLRWDAQWEIPRGISLEKIAPDLNSSFPQNWLPSASELGATPTTRNSYAIEFADESVSVSPNPFSPDGDGKDDLLFIKYSYNFAPFLDIKIFDVTGREIRTLASGEIYPPDGVITWDGLKNNGTRARMGIYLMKIQVKDALSGKARKYLKTFVLAR